VYGCATVGEIACEPQRRRTLAKAAATAATGADLTAHRFRHFAASALIAGGASVKQVQAFLGHASAVITLRTYAHLWPGDEDRNPKRAGCRSQSACGLSAD
jgi:integrase